MAFSNRVRTHAGIATIVAFILVAVFGSPAYAHWAAKQSEHNLGGLFLQWLAWPSWTFSTDQTLRTLLAEDLRAILVIVLTYIFVSAIATAEGAGFRGVVGRLLGTWAGFIFAAAVAGLIAALVVKNASAVGAVQGALGGAQYGVIVGWIVGLIALAA